ncbi:hypothetical protein [Humidesulfovibrio idahonensis]
MRKRVIPLLVVLVLGIGVYSSYEAYAYYRYTKAVHGALQSCSARISLVLSHTEYEPADLERALRNINEAIAYVDGIVAGVHVHADGTVHFRDEQSMKYMQLCAETLRKDKTFVEAALEYAKSRTDSAAHGVVGGGGPGHGVMSREQRFGELMRQHAALREQLTELYNENYEMREVAVPLEELVDSGSIEHAQQVINACYNQPG